MFTGNLEAIGMAAGTGWPVIDGLGASIREDRGIHPVRDACVLRLTPGDIGRRGTHVRPAPPIAFTSRDTGARPPRRAPGTTRAPPEPSGRPGEPRHLYRIGLDAAARVAPPEVLRYLSLAGVLIYGGTGVVNMLLGADFLDYGSLVPSHPSHGQHYGILAVEFGVGLTVASTMVLIFFALGGRGRGDENIDDGDTAS